MNETEYEKLVKRVERAAKRLADHMRSGLDDPNAKRYRREFRQAIEAMHEYLHRPPGQVLTLVVDPEHLLY